MNSEPILRPLPYHVDLRDYLMGEEPEVWQWFCAHQADDAQAESIRFDLLKSTFRVDRDTRGEWYAAAGEAAGRLGLDVPITIYQSQNPVGKNASLAYLPGEAHIVLHGAVAAGLNQKELQALFAHELSHLLLWHQWNGDYLRVAQMLSALVLDRHAEPVHFATKRLFDLYTEIFCDRGALHATGDVMAVVSMLIKVVTDSDSVDPASYLKQADEVFAVGTPRSEDVSHPEVFIRARALRLWSALDPRADDEVVRMIEGDAQLATLDLLGQRRVGRLTRRLITRLLTPAWLRTEAVLGHARLFFEDFEPPGGDHTDPNLAEDLATADEHLRDYYCFVVLDFVTADRELEEAPLACALRLCDELGWRDRFFEIARRELRLRKNQLAKIDADKDQLLERVAGENTE